MDEKLRYKREKNEKLSEDIKILSMLKKVADMDDENLWSDVLNTVTKVIDDAKQDSDIDEKTEIENAKLGFVGHTIKTADGFMYKNYSLNEKITNYATLSTIEDIEIALDSSK